MDNKHKCPTCGAPTKMVYNPEEKDNLEPNKPTTKPITKPKRMNVPDSQLTEKQLLKRKYMKRWYAKKRKEKEQKERAKKRQANEGKSKNDTITK